VHAVGRVRISYGYRAAFGTMARGGTQPGVRCHFCRELACGNTPHTQIRLQHGGHYAGLAAILRIKHGIA